MKVLFSFLTVGFLTAQTYALEPEPGAVFCRVIDVGGGLACVVEMPGENGDNHYMIYDAGHWNTDNAVLSSVQEIIPDGEEIDLMVLSHSDSDHLGAVDEILDAYRVRRVLRTGMPRTTGTWRDANDAIRMEHEQEGCIDINLQYFEYPAGATYRFGDAYVTMVCGFGEAPAEWGPLSQSERRNAVSICVRLQFNGQSILFTGDAVGRHIGDPVDALIATEQYMVDNSAVITIDSDVLIAPHHGADNGSSTAFIEAVSPEFVIFGAGHAHRHPRASAVQRYLDFGLTTSDLFRTDLGDDEGGDEWSFGSSTGASDPSGDDDVDVLIRSSGQVLVEYRN